MSAVSTTGQQSLLFNNSSTDRPRRLGTADTVTMDVDSWTFTDSTNQTPVDFDDGITIAAGQAITGDGDLTLGVAAGAFDITLQMGDAAGAQKVSFVDSASAEVFSVDSDGNVVIGNNLDVLGTTTSFDSTNVNIADRYTLHNSNYTSDTPLTAGVTFNIDPIAGTNTPVAISSFTAPDTITVAADTTGDLSAGDVLIVAGANDTDNNGLYEVLSVTAADITINTGPGVALAGIVKTAVVTDATSGGVATQTTITTLRADTGGSMSVGSGSDNSLTYDTLVTITGTGDRLVRMDGSSALQDSGVTLDDSDNFTGINSLRIDENASAPLTPATGTGLIWAEPIAGAASISPVPRWTDEDAIDHLLQTGYTSTRSLPFNVGFPATVTGIEVGDFAIPSGATAPSAGMFLVSVSIISSSSQNSTALFVIPMKYADGTAGGIWQLLRPLVKSDRNGSSYLLNAAISQDSTTGLASLRVWSNQSFAVADTVIRILPLGAEGTKFTEGSTNFSGFAPPTDTFNGTTFTIDQTSNLLRAYTSLRIAYSSNVATSPALLVENTNTGVTTTVIQTRLPNNPTIATTQYWMDVRKGGIRMGGVRGNGDGTTVIYEAFAGDHNGQCPGSTFVSGNPSTINDGTRNWDMGMILCTNGTMVSDGSLMSEQPQVVLATGANNKTVVGVYNCADDDAADLAGFNPDLAVCHYRALGHGKVLVTNENGNVDSGDLVTTSPSSPGYGCKQADDILHNYTVCKLVEQINWVNISQTVNGHKYALATCFVYSG